MLCRSWIRLFSLLRAFMTLPGPMNDMAGRGPSRGKAQNEVPGTSFARMALGLSHALLQGTLPQPQAGAACRRGQQWAAGAGSPGQRAGAGPLSRRPFTAGRARPSSLLGILPARVRDASRSARVLGGWSPGTDSVTAGIGPRSSSVAGRRSAQAGGRGSSLQGAPAGRLGRCRPEMSLLHASCRVLRGSFKLTFPPRVSSPGVGGAPLCCR